jgi:acyl-CoA dehydrogenase
LDIRLHDAAAAEVNNRIRTADMVTLIELLVVLVVIGFLMARQASRYLWVGLLGAGLVFWSIFHSPPGWALLLAWLVYIPIAALLTLPALRLRLVSSPLLALFARLMPAMSDTEREALEAGSVWWEAEVFSGQPDWHHLLGFPAPQLSAEEQAFLDGPVEELCAMINDWEITEELRDLNEETWDYLKRQGFFGMIIPKQYGGLEFSANAHSVVVMKIASVSISAGVTVMVPNSLGPAELLLTYGTDAQKDHYLPRLANGTEIPCFALTGPEAGSDAASMPDNGIVCRQPFNDEADVLGIRLNWEKRYITLGPVATLLGLAFHLYDPDHLLGDKEDIGITLALIPTSTPGVEIGKRHFPMSQSFMNGPNSGRDVFIPMDWIIGGQEFVGQGWRMLMNCLSVGRAISLPALSTASGQRDQRGAGPHCRQCLYHERGARLHHRRHRFRRRPLRGLGDCEVPADGTHAPGRERRHGHTRRARHQHGPEKLRGARLRGPADRHHRRGRQHPHPQPDHLRPGGNPLPPLPVQGN